MLNDGVYGQRNAWNLDPARMIDSNGFVALRFQNAVRVNRIAFGRDNNRAFNNKITGDYSVEYTLDPDVDDTTPEEQWMQLFIHAAKNDPTNMDAGLRKLFQINPTIMTGMRIKLTPPTATDEIMIDEIEAYGVAIGGVHIFLTDVCISTLNFHYIVDSSIAQIII
jgi:hypothetical protein